jgi:hypothetical protein
VLNTRTSEKNGEAAEPGGSDVTAGMVTVSAEREGGGARRSASTAAAGKNRSEQANVFFFILITGPESTGRRQRGRRL